MTFFYSPTSDGTFNGLLNMNGGISVYTSRDLLMSENFSYQGSISVGGGSVSSFSCNFSGNITMDLTTYSVVS